MPPQTAATTASVAIQPNVLSAKIADPRAPDRLVFYQT